MKKRMSKVQQISIPNTKITCAKFAQVNHNTFATGDDHNNIAIWAYGYDKSLAVQTSYQVLNTQTQTDKKVQVSALTFSIQDKQIICGSNRGVINIWDNQSKKVKNTLGGHNTVISALSTFPRQAKCIASGSYDTNIKLWDLRTRDSYGTLKTHTMQINALEVSPDQNYLISGSQDNTIKFWELRMPYKVIHTFGGHQAPINCLKFNPEQMLFASGSSDKTAKVWQLQSPFSHLSSTKTDATPVTSISFTEDGKYLFTAANDSLKLWNIASIDAKMIDNIETSWKKIQDLVIYNEMILGLGGSATLFSVYGCDLKRIAFDGKKVRPFIQKYQQQNVKKMQQDLFSDIRQAQKNVDNAIDLNLQKNMHKKYQIPQNIQSSPTKQQNMINKIKLIKVTPSNNQKITSPIKQPPLIQQNNYTQYQSSIIGSSQLNKTMNFQNFYQQQKKKSNPSKQKQQQMIKQISNDHQKFHNNLSTRILHTKPIVHWWKDGNIKSALHALNEVQNISVHSDIMQFALSTQKAKQLPIDAAIIFSLNCGRLIENKHIAYIKNGLKFMQKIVNIFRDVHIVQTFEPMGGNKVDIARDQRVRKYDQLLVQFQAFFQVPRLAKLKHQEKTKDFQTAQHARILIQDLNYIIVKCNKKS